MQRAETTATLPGGRPELRSVRRSLSVWPHVKESDGFDARAGIRAPQDGAKQAGHVTTVAGAQAVTTAWPRREGKQAGKKQTTKKQTSPMSPIVPASKLALPRTAL